MKRWRQFLRICKSGMLQSFGLPNLVLFFPGALPITVKLKDDINLCYGIVFIAQSASVRLSSRRRLADWVMENLKILGLT